MFNRVFFTFLPNCLVYNSDLKVNVQSLLAMTTHLEWLTMLRLVTRLDFWVFHLKTVLKLGLLSPRELPNTVLAGTQDTYSSSKRVLTEHKGVSDVFLTTRLVTSY